jgi:hypothetical protein
MNGYAHQSYAASLMEFGSLHKLARSGGWILKREIPGFPYWDAMGCYPLFACNDWSQISYDLEDIAREIVSISLVADPFGNYTPPLLQECFDRVFTFKEHFIVDLDLSVKDFVTKHHRYYARKSLRDVTVECITDPVQFTDEWVDLYGNLIERYHLKGIKSFSSKAFALQLSVPGIVMFRASEGDTAVGAHLWYQQGEVAYSHLLALNPRGYDVMASYGLYWSALEYFPGRVRWLDLGGTAGLRVDDTGGLDSFKKGWSTGTRTAYFCGRIFDQDHYREITRARGISNADYFPAYRTGEFV